MSGGTFSVARSIWDHPEFRPSEFSEREAFLWLVSEASWKPRRVREGRVVVDLRRGQLCKSVRFMAEAWGWSKSRVGRFIERLEKRDMIGTDSGTGQLVVTLRNYDKFQLGWDASGTEAGRDPGQDRDSSGTKEKKGKKGKKEEGGRGPAPADEIDPDPAPADPPADPAPCDRIRAAARITEVDEADQRRVAYAWADHHLLGRLTAWRGLGLSDAEIAAEIAALTAKKRDGPAHTPGYFDTPLRRFAGSRTRPALVPIEGGSSHGPTHFRPSAAERRAEASRARLDRRLAFAASLSGGD